MLDQIRKFASPTRRNEEGASAVEYGLLVALIAAVVVVAVVALGGLVEEHLQRHLRVHRHRVRTATAATNNCETAAATTDRS